MKPRLRRTPLICFTYVISRAISLEAHIQANELLVDAGREVAFFFKDMLELGNYSLTQVNTEVSCNRKWWRNLFVAIEGVTLILETEIEEAPEDDYGIAKLIQEKIVKVN